MCKIYRYHWSNAWTFRLLDGLLSGSDVHVEPHPSGCLQAEARGNIALNMLLNKIVAKRYPIGLVALPLPLHMLLHGLPPVQPQKQSRSCQCEAIGSSQQLKVILQLRRELLEAPLPMGDASKVVRARKEDRREGGDIASA